MFDDLPPNGAILAGTGHRPDKIGGQEAGVRAAIRGRLRVYWPEAVFTGMALGFDTWWGEEAAELGISVIAVVPFLGQMDPWPAVDRERYLRLLRRCYTVHTLNMARPRSPAQAAAWLHQRNSWMVENSWGTVACYNGDAHGGTANTVRLAKARKKPLDIIDPYSLESVLS